MRELPGGTSDFTREEKDHPLGEGLRREPVGSRESTGRGTDGLGRGTGARRTGHRLVREGRVGEPHAGYRAFLAAPPAELRVVEQPLRLAERRDGRRESARTLQPAGAHQRQPRVVPGVIELGELGIHRESGARLLEHPRDRREVLGHGVGAERLARQSLRLEQQGATAVEVHRRPVTELVDEQPLEQGLQHLVVAVGPAVVVERREELPGGQLLEHHGAALPLEQRVA